MLGASSASGWACLLTGSPQSWHVQLSRVYTRCRLTSEMTQPFSLARRRALDARLLCASLQNLGPGPCATYGSPHSWHSPAVHVTVPSWPFAACLSLRRACLLRAPACRLAVAFTASRAHDALTDSGLAAFHRAFSCCLFCLSSSVLFPCFTPCLALYSACHTRQRSFWNARLHSGFPHFLRCRPVRGSPQYGHVVFASMPPC